MSSANQTKPPESVLRERRTVLSRAIKNASRPLLQRTLEQICQELPVAEVAATHKLLTTEDRARQEGDSSDNSESEDLSDSSETQTKPTTTPKAAGTKRIRTRYAFCENCEEEYDVETNSKDSCSYHPGMLL